MVPEQSETWLPIIEYSVKTGVSLSTIRRKIKNGSIPFRLDKGKYLILYGGQQPAGPVAPLQVSQILQGTMPVSTPVNIPNPVRVQTPAPAPAPMTPKAPDETVRLVTDAYEYAMKEKEERIRLLERRNKDLESHLDELRLLVQVLEEKYEVRY